jgi:small-conductance mechanosensitive channel
LYGEIGSKGFGRVLMSKVKVSMTIENDIYDRFKEYCKANGMKISTKVEQLMNDVLKNVSLQRFMKK